MESKNKQPFLSLNRLKQSFVYALQGVRFTWKREQNFRIHTVISVFVLVMAQLLQIPYQEQLILIIVIGAVLGMELINTALEHVVDLVVQTYDDRAKVIKDTAAGAVFVFSITAAIIGMMIFIPHLVKWF
ncbi:diacylglycerol kinase family protein [Salisediminibacterium selenitireducens]|uniref:Diacylglycerol kinase n=1 Tax=Bacillus selenitireducens (strain ATCC 700615 / DSM 15326 / MLS10) TaxID=439292 RepID=D6XWA4_BACIE|nr:diacylglycerol kinase family protein [Salisediminibacterium selenitireducens]ADH99858.1 diacylglycerol kinase [[Bacillus] selenitireducens MLS10]